MIVYHYTTRNAYNEILNTGELRPSSPWTSLDAAYGYGWYFTDLEPNTCDMAISYFAWLQTVLRRTEYYLKFDIDAALLKKTREHVWMLPQNLIRDGLIKLTTYTKGNKTVITFTENGRKGDCALKPCETCQVGNSYKK